ncbi:MAG: hypothetical protein JWP57_2115 [Spirosoma sp.]|nr:hypothetical protein [Spirosoma sp.]
MAAKRLIMTNPVAYFWLYGKLNQQHVMETGGESQQQREEQGEGIGKLVHIETENVDASGVEDDSTGMGQDDYLGRTNKEEKESE